MRKKHSTVLMVLLALVASLSLMTPAKASPLSQPVGSFVGFSYGSTAFLEQYALFGVKAVLLLVLKPGQAPIVPGDTLIWHSQYDSEITSDWIGGTSKTQFGIGYLDLPGSAIAQYDFEFICDGGGDEQQDFTFVKDSICLNGDYVLGDGLALLFFTRNLDTFSNVFDGQSVDIFIVTPPEPVGLTLPPDFLTPKTYGNPAPVTGYAPAAPATPITPTAPVITASATSVIYNGVPQSAAYSVDQKLSCSTTYNGSAIPPVAAGSYAVSITCSANSLTSTATTTLTITKASPVISWSTPGAITTATKLSSSQLNAFSYIPGSFTYSASAGSSLPIGDDLITATFTPTDSTNYTSATMTVTIKVTA